MTVPVIALLGAADPLGEAVLEALATRDLGIGEVLALDDAATDRCARFHGRELPVAAVADLDLAGPGILVCASRSSAVGPLAARAAAAGWPVIALAESLPEAVATAALVVPSAAAQALWRSLSSLLRHVALESLSVVVFPPVAVAGQAGIEELAGQTRALFAMGDVEAETFPVQIAFNLIPQVGPRLDTGETGFERGVAVQFRQLAHLPDLPVSVTAVWSPLFHGGAMAVHGVVRDGLELGPLRKWLAATDGITLMDAPLPGGVPTPATDAGESEDVFVGRVRVDGRHFSCWLVLDTMRLEAARIVDELEKLIEK